MFAIMNVLSQGEIVTGPELVSRVKPKLSRTQAYQRLSDCINSKLVETVPTVREGKPAGGYSLSWRGVESMSPFGLTTTEVTSPPAGSPYANVKVDMKPGEPARFHRVSLRRVKGGGQIRVEAEGPTV